MRGLKHYLPIFLILLLTNSFIEIPKKGKLIFEKIAIAKNHRGLFVRKLYIRIIVPANYEKKWQFKTYHGSIAGIYYPDSSTIYYWDDSYIMTPNGSNYRTIDFNVPIGWLINDTIIFGKQSNGKYWKEKFTNHYWIGYRDVPENKIGLFDKSLETFRRDW